MGNLRKSGSDAVAIHRPSNLPGVFDFRTTLPNPEATDSFHARTPTARDEKLTSQTARSPTKRKIVSAQILTTSAAALMRRPVQ
jgi:hypothetical protein